MDRSSGSGPRRPAGSTSGVDAPMLPVADLITEFEKPQGPEPDTRSWWRRLLGL